MNAIQALAELDRHPAFKRELAELLELGRELAKLESWMRLGQAEEKLARLGAQIELRDSLDRDL